MMVKSLLDNYEGYLLPFARVLLEADNFKMSYSDFFGVLSKDFGISDYGSLSILIGLLWCTEFLEVDSHELAASIYEAYEEDFNV